VNERPSTEASWAISLAGPMRSRRTASESRSVLGISVGLAVEPEADSASSTVLVSSSTNRGTPSVRATIWRRTASDRGLPVPRPVSRSISCAASCSLMGVRLSCVRCARGPHMASMVSGRTVSTSSSGADTA
jgi:hypothetical protein